MKIKLSSALGAGPLALVLGIWGMEPNPPSPVPMEPEPWLSLQPWATSVFLAMCLSVSLGHTHENINFSVASKASVWWSWGRGGHRFFRLKWSTWEILNTLEFVSRDRLLAESATFLH